MSDLHQHKRLRTNTNGPASFPAERLGHTSRPQLRHQDYTVGWICALPLELAAGQAMLDQLHESLPGRHADSNAYTLGSIGPHNVVMACLPKGGIGNNNAAVVASNMLSSFPSIKQRLMVGIGGGAPGLVDIRLGDVVVGDQVVQYDLGKANPGHFERTAVPTKPPPAILTAVSKLNASHAHRPSRIPELIGEMLSRYPTMTRFQRPDIPDLLFQHSYNHRAQGITCQDCDRSMLIRRSSRDTPHPRIWHGTIASGNTVVKDGVTRETLASELRAICFEMESAGLGDSFPSLAIRGICDYSDSHKNKDWQEYAAAVASAHAKELLLDIPGNPPAIPSGDSSALLTTSTQLEKPTIEAVRETHGPTLQEKRDWLLKSLFFDTIQLRHRNIKSAYSKTCQWFLKHQSFLDWQDLAKLNQHSGFLWISGKPGAGKSTMMKFIHAYMKNKWARDSHVAVINFFFNARGTTNLEKSTEGMYRSLLYQILEHFNDLQPLVDIYGRREASEADYLTTSWTLDSLRDLYRSVVESLGSRRLTCLIDALDECDEDQIRDMVEFFEELGEAAAEHSTMFLTCFASRHYPHIAMRSRILRVTLEDQLGHSQDIEQYVQSKLKTGTSRSTVVEQINGLIVEKAAGVFMWVVLVVEILNRDLQRGRIRDALKRLKELPARLSDLFRDILKREDTDLDELLLCIQWILYAKRPLTCPELYFAIQTGLPHGSDFPDEWDADYETPEIMRLFILSTSKGLAEVTGKEETVQFIHESVRDFLLKDNGIDELWPRQPGGFDAHSHARLKMCCIDYAHLSRVSRWHFNHIPNMPSHKSRTASVEKPLTLRGILLRTYPFLDYSINHVLHHADSGLPTDDGGGRLGDFDFDRWLCLYNVCQRFEAASYDPRTTPLWVFTLQSHTNLIKEYLVDPSHVAQCFPCHPIFAAISEGHAAAFQVILEYGVPDELRDASGDTTLITAIERGNKDFVRALLLQPGGRRKQHDVEAQVASLLPVRHSGVDPISRRPLVVEGDVFALEGEHGMSALKLAVLSDDWDLVKLIIATRVRDINKPDVSGRTMLSYAAEKGTHEMVQGLLNVEGINANLPDSKGWTPLMWAVQRNHGKVARQLLARTEIDINARNSDGETALLLATKSGRVKLMKELLQIPDIDVNVRSKRGATALIIAARNGQEEAIKELLTIPSLDVNSPDDIGITALSWAILKNEPEIFRQLLKAPGLDINARGEYERTVLIQSATQKRLEAITELLKMPEVDVNALDEDGSSALDWAVYYGYDDIATLLRQAGGRD